MGAIGSGSVVVAYSLTGEGRRAFALPPFAGTQPLHWQGPAPAASEEGRVKTHLFPHFCHELIMGPFSP